MEEENVLTRTRTGIGYPLTPNLFKELDLWYRVPETSENFDPAGSWTQVYRVVTSQGFYENKPSEKGHLQITRTAGSSDDTFLLTVDQVIVHTEAVVHTYRAEITCANNTLASPIKWSMSSRFVDSEGEPRGNLDQDEVGQVESDTVIIQTNGIEHEQKGNVTGDWCLFEAVQRLPFESGGPLAFDLLETMSIVRPDQNLAYHGTDCGFHYFHQVGSGALPFQYWLDDKHRLVTVVTGARAYILDWDAEKGTAAAKAAGNKLYSAKKEYYSSAR